MVTRDRGLGVIWKLIYRFQAFNILCLAEVKWIWKENSVTKFELYYGCIFINFISCFISCLVLVIILPIWEELLHFFPHSFSSHNNFIFIQFLPKNLFISLLFSLIFNYCIPFGPFHSSQRNTNTEGRMEYRGKWGLQHKQREYREKRTIKGDFGSR